MNSNRSFHGNPLRGVCSILATAVALSGWAPTAWGELQFISNNSGLLWPSAEQAAVRTSIMPEPTSTRGVRGDRIQAQTFQVQEAFELDRVFLAYGWVGGTSGGPLETNFTKIRIVEVDDVFATTGYTAGAEVAPQVSFAILEEPPSENPGGFYAIELKWDASVDGPLMLAPREGNQGYALEINGTHVGRMSSAIDLVERQGNPGGPYPFGRAYEMIGLGQTGPFTNGNYDFPMAMTAVPSLPGNFDGDDDVDGDDLATWKLNFGSTTADSSTGDADGDGDADGNDFLIWQRNVTGSVNEIVPVPEPATAGLAACGFVAAAVCGHWKRGRSLRRRA